jgi:hypothetical protein
MAEGTEEDPHTKGGVDHRWEYCKCGACGDVSRCTPDNDFYVTKDGPALKCESCFKAYVRATTSPERN